MFQNKGSITLWKECVLLIIITNIYRLESPIRLKSIDYAAETLHNMQGRRVPVCNLTNDVTKKKSYGSHMNANVEENAIQMCSKIRVPSHFGKNAILFITISNIF